MREEEPDHQGWKSLPLHHQTQLVPSDSPKSSTVQLSACAGGTAQCLQRVSTYLSWFCIRTLILRFTSYVLTCYPYQHFLLFVLHPISLHFFLYLDGLTKLTIKL